MPIWAGVERPGLSKGRCAPLPVGGDNCAPVLPARPGLRLMPSSRQMVMLLVPFFTKRMYSRCFRKGWTTWSFAFFVAGAI